MSSVPPQTMTGIKLSNGAALQDDACSFLNCGRHRKGLMIGINYSRQYGQLQGHADDARNMAAYLVEHCGYRREDMVILTDDRQGSMSQPNKRNILRAMHWLVKGAAPSDLLFFYYSGHGVRVGEFNSNKSDGFDAIIYPVDFRQHGHIANEEMDRIMIRPLQTGVGLTAFFDSCCPGESPVFPSALEGPNMTGEVTRGR